jgi:hypothetical protein
MNLTDATVEDMVAELERRGLQAAVVTAPRAAQDGFAVPRGDQLRSAINWVRKPTRILSGVMLMRIIGLLPVLVVSLSLTSCGPTAKEQLVGKWKGKSQGATVEKLVEFTADGKFIQQSVGVDGPVLNGTYQWVDKETIETEVTVPTGAKIKEKSTVTVSKDSLTLKNQQGKVDHFTREP